MRVFVDGEANEMDDCSLGDALAHAARTAQQRGRCIIEVFLDHNPLGQDDLAALDERSEPCGELRLVTSPIVSVTRETLAGACSALDEIARLQQSAGELLQTTHAAEAMNALQAALALWNLVRDSVAKSAEITYIQLDAIAAEGVSMSQGIERLSKNLQEIGAAVRIKDHVRLADTLLYEMPDVTAVWRNLLAALDREIC